MKIILTLSKINITRLTVITMIIAVNITGIKKILISSFKGSRAPGPRPLPRSPPRERPGRERQVFRGSQSADRGSYR